MSPDVLIVVAARNEAERIAATLAGLAQAFPGAPVWVADDGSRDRTAALARAAGARVVGEARAKGKGQAMSAAMEAALGPSGMVRREGHGLSAAAGAHVETSGATAPISMAPISTESIIAESIIAEPVGAEPIVLLCDGDLGDSARELSALVDVLRRGDADLAVAAFATRMGGGFGLALAFARWAIRRRCGLSTRAPISGQRALRARAARDVLPFAPRFGMEIGITIDAVRAGHRVVEVDLDLAHRATRRTPAGFLHRARQLADFIRVYRARG